MGNSTSVERINKDISNVVSQSIMKTIQRQTDNVTFSQSVLLNCETFQNINGAALVRCLQFYKDNVTLKELVCSAYLKVGCELKNVDLNQYGVITLSGTQRQQVQASLATQLTKDLKSQISEKYRLFNFNSLTEQNIQDVVNTTTNITETNLQQILNSILNKQSIQINGGYVNVVKMDQAITYISSALQSNLSFNSVVTSLSTSIRSNIAAQNKTLNIVLYSGIAVVFVTLVIVLLIVFLRKKA